MMRTPTSAATHPVAEPAPLGQVLGDLVALTKPRLSGLVLFTAGGGLWLSGVPASAATWVGTLVGTALVVGSANALNMYLERDLDGLMARTQSRPLPAGRLPAWSALAFSALLAIASLPMIAASSNALTTSIAALALVLYAFVYTPLKQMYPICTLVGAIPGAIPPLIGWTAATGRIEAGGVALFALLFAWQLPHSLAIGMYRHVEYRAAGIKVLPVVRGFAAARWHILAWTVLQLLASLVLLPLGIGSWLTFATALALGGYYLFRAVVGLLRDGGAKWARGLFLYSLVYLMGLFTVLGVDHALFGA